MKITPFPNAPWFSIDEDAYLMYLLRGYEIRYRYEICGLVDFLLDGNRHREDGPARVWDDGVVSYYLNNKWYPKNEYYKALKDGNY